MHNLDKDLIATLKQAAELCDSVMTWWEEHQYDTYGEYGDYNVYSQDPDFVVKARAVQEQMKLLTL